MIDIDSVEQTLADSVCSTLLKAPDTKTVIIAYSGGVDSHVLLYACSLLLSRFINIDFKSIYIDHGLHSDSKKWRDHCEKIAKSLAIPFQSIVVDAKDVKGEGPEQAARHARYDAFKRQVKKNCLLLTAQHQDDQAETLLLQLLRGCGVQGLAGMPVLDGFSEGHIGRPFLGVSRELIVQYAVKKHLKWVEDPSNEDSSFNRNYLRNKVVPLIKKRWPAFSVTTSRTAQHCADASALINNLSIEYMDLEKPYRLDLSTIQLLDNKVQRAVLRHWLALNNVQMPSSKVLLQLQKNVIQADIGKSPKLIWAEYEIRRFENFIYLMKKLPRVLASLNVNWSGLRCSLPDMMGTLQLSPCVGQGVKQDFWKANAVTVRTRQGGEKIKLRGRHGTRKLKKLLNEQAMPNWLRERLPLIYIAGELVGVADLWIDEHFLANADEQGYKILWEHPDLL